jgi:hypothetical protein
MPGTDPGRFLAMQRIALIVILALALALPAEAVAARSYSGDFDGSGALSFKLAKRKGKTKVKEFEFEQVPVVCDSGPETTSGHLNFSPRVRRKEFRARGHNDAGGRVRVKGKLKNKRKRAEGTFRIFGTIPTDDGGTGVDCGSGTISWNATRA